MPPVSAAEFAARLRERHGIEPEAWMLADVLAQPGSA